MRLLVLGGTRFVGLAIVEAALAAGHEVGVFHRGRSGATFSRPVETLVGDRMGDLGALRGGRWDAAIDVSGFQAEPVRASLELLADEVEHYTFISTIGVYASFREAGMTEEAPLAAAEERTLAIDGSTYGPMKVACEAEVRRILPDRHTVIRPGIIVGPEDYTDRFPFWCRRVAAGGEVLAPGDPMQPAQWIDARDLGEWTVRVTERRQGGTFNAAGPGLPSTLAGMLEGIRLATGSDAEFAWVPTDGLHRLGADPDREFPFFLPPERQGQFAVDSRRAIEQGLAFRPFEETVRDTLAWDRGRAPEERTAGISGERETELLRRWKVERAGSAR
jgi:2'-hydroxyisoflavone reductase